MCLCQIRNYLHNRVWGMIRGKVATRMDCLKNTTSRYLIFGCGLLYFSLLAKVAAKHQIKSRTVTSAILFRHPKYSWMYSEEVRGLVTAQHFWYDSIACMCFRASFSWSMLLAVVNRTFSVSYVCPSELPEVCCGENERRTNEMSERGPGREGRWAYSTECSLKVRRS